MPDRFGHKTASNNPVASRVGAHDRLAFCQFVAGRRRPFLWRATFKAWPPGRIGRAGYEAKALQSGLAAVNSKFHCRR